MLQFKNTYIGNRPKVSLLKNNTNFTNNIVELHVDTCTRMRLSVTAEAPKEAHWETVLMQTPPMAFMLMNASYLEDDDQDANGFCDGDYDSVV